MTKQKHFKRRVRERMQETGESYTTARLHLLGHAPVAPRENLPSSGRVAQVRLRSRRSSRRARPQLGLQSFAPACGMVISLTIGVVALLTIMTPNAPSPSPSYVTEGQP